MAAHWTLDDIPWEKFDRRCVPPDLLRAVKAAAMVEHNALDYVTYLCSVFAEDAAFQAAARQWGGEEVQHGEALARWAALADPSFDFAAGFQRFRDGYSLPLDATASVRGSRTGELIARCVVEVGTSSFYSAIRDVTNEPVLQAIASRIAGDEFRHYKLFYTYLARYAEREPLPLWRRLKVAFGRLREVDDDELAFAYYCANNPPESYDRKRHAAAYSAAALPLYRFGHIQRGIGMVLKACGLDPQSRLARLVTRLAWAGLRHRVAAV